VTIGDQELLRGAEDMPSAGEVPIFWACSMVRLATARSRPRARVTSRLPWGSAMTSKPGAATRAEGGHMHAEQPEEGTSRGPTGMILARAAVLICDRTLLAA